MQGTFKAGLLQLQSEIEQSILPSHILLSPSHLLLLHISTIGFPAVYQQMPRDLGKVELQEGMASLPSEAVGINSYLYSKDCRGYAKFQEHQH